jgi:hypothetical protein
MVMHNLLRRWLVLCDLLSMKVRVMKVEPKVEFSSEGPNARAG